MDPISAVWYIDEKRLWNGCERPSGSLAARRIANLLYQRTQKNHRDEPIKILSRDAMNRSRRPIAWLGEKRLKSHFSLSHGERFVAVAHSESRRIGIDVVDHAKISENALLWALSPAERKWIQSDPLRLRQIWSAKEAAFKASRLKTFYPRQIEIDNCDHCPNAVVRSLKIQIQWLSVGTATVSLASRFPCTWTQIENLL